MRKVYTGADGLAFLKRKEARLVISASVYNSTPAQEYLKELPIVYDIYRYVDSSRIFCAPMWFIKRMQRDDDYDVELFFDGDYCKIYVVYIGYSIAPVWYIYTAST